MKILIVGGGIAGLTLGAFLQDSNIEFDIIEKAADWSHLGFLLSMWDSGRDILKKLGLADRFDQSGTRTHLYSIRDGSGRVLRNFDLSWMYAEYGAAITILERRSLHGWLLEKVGASRVVMGLSPTAISQNDAGVSVTFSDGQTKTYDLVVGADGVHSSVRALAFSDCVESYENWRVWFTWIDHAFNEKPLVAEYVAPREFAIVCSAGEKTTAWFFAPADHAVWDSADDRIERLKQLLKEETFLIPQSLEKLQNRDVVPTDLLRVTLKSWWSGRVVLAGDAAHSLGPLAGIGSTMALEDAYVLAGELMRVSNAYPLKTALRTYERVRRARIKYAEGMSRNIKHGMLVRSPVLRAAFNMLIPFLPERYSFKNIEKLLQQEI